jgi:hypothetical protein
MENVSGRCRQSKTRTNKMNHINYIYEGLYLVSLFCFAYIHAIRFDLNKTIDHLIWGLISGGLIGLIFIFSEWNWLLLLCLILERIVFFSPTLNLLRHPQKPFFYLNPESNERKLNFDALIYVIWEPFWGACVIALIFLQFYL